MKMRMVHHQKAQGMVEFALVLPLLLLVMFLIIEFGRAIFIYAAVFSASREGARYGAAAGNVGNYVPHYQDCAGIQAAARRIGSLVGLQSVSVQYRIFNEDGTFTRLGCNATNAARVRLGDQVEVSVSATYQPILPLVRLRSLAISSMTARTVLKDISIRGTPAAPPGSVCVRFDPTSAEGFEDSLGTVSAVVRLSAPYSEDVVVPFNVGGTATMNNDYTISSSPVTIIAGQTSANILIDVTQDTLYEPDETVDLTLGDPVNASLCGSDTTYTLTIKNDEPPPSVTFTQASQTVNETSGSTSIVLQLSSSTSVDVLVPFSVDPISSTATLGSDYSFNTVSPVVIPAGQVNAHINLTINDDHTDEIDEVFKVVMGTPVNAVQGAITWHTVTILDNDLPPSVSFAAALQQVTEAAGRVGALVKLTAASEKPITVPYSLSGTAGLGSDYTIQPSPLVITPGLTTASIPVNIIQDTVPEPDETITITMGTLVNAIKIEPSVHTVLITTQVLTPTVYFVPSQMSASESVGTMHIEVKLSWAYPMNVVVPFTLSGTASPGLDYTTLPSPVVIPAGSMYADFPIQVANDNLDEADETVIVTMGEPTNAVRSPDLALTVATILDDDDQPTVSFTSTSQSAREDVGVMPVTVRLSAISGLDVMVPFTLDGSTATVGEDYTVTPYGYVTIPAGYQTGTININVNNDDYQGGNNLGEPDETVVITLGTPTNAGLSSPSVHTATILAWVCPTGPSNPYFGSGSDSKKLNWDIQYAGVGTLNLLEVTVSWPTNGGTRVESITFGNTIGSGYYPATTGYLDVVNPSPLWSGSFTTRQMVFVFSRHPDFASGSIEVSARFEHCRPFSKRIGN